MEEIKVWDNCQEWERCYTALTNKLGLEKDTLKIQIIKKKKTL